MLAVVEELGLTVARLVLVFSCAERVEELVKELPRMFWAASLFVQPTTTPIVEFMGRAKHASPGPQVVNMNDPELPQLPVRWPMHAISPLVHGDVLFSVEKSWL